ncbi:MAG: hypothetical protein HRU15_15780 [Planctomycetes bacterium]|nr:hypothetical protein [Planctomycetota bacterium]
MGFAEGIGKLDGSEYVISGSGEKIYAHPGAHPVKDHVYDPPHSAQHTMNQLWGGAEYTGQAPDCSGAISAIWPEGNHDAEHAFMGCFDDQDMQLPAMMTLAKNFVVCDRSFSAMPGPTGPNRIFIHAATCGAYTGSAYLPDDGLDMPETMQSIFEALDDSDPNLGWALYDMYPDLYTPMAFPYVRKHQDHFRSLEQFEQDCFDDNLPAYSVITPGKLFANSQHAGGDGSSLVDGDNYIASVYEALRRNKKVFEKTLFFITYDEAGGYWDSVVSTDVMPQLSPIEKHANWPQHKSPDYDFKYLGVRIPGLLISPWLDHGVNSTLFEHASVAATVKQLFNTTAKGPDGFLTERDQAANDFVSSLQLRDTPRTDAIAHLPRSKYNREMLEARAKYAYEEAVKQLKASE